jgi:hypothetical protein
MRSLLLGSVFLLGCAADTYGLADDTELDTGSVLEDSTATSGDSSIGDDTKPLFDADEDATADTGSVAVDSGTKMDSAPIDSSIVVDTGVDTGIDTGIDTGVVSTDSGIDTELVDTGTPDTGTADTGTADTGMADTGTADTGTADTGTGDTGSAADTGTTDTGEPVLMSSANRVACTDGAGGTLLCPTGQICCGVSGAYACKTSCASWDKDYRCDEKADCGSGEVCCAKEFLGSYEGSQCLNKDYCYNTRFCMTHAECGTGKTCVPFKLAGLYTMGRCN